VAHHHETTKPKARHIFHHFTLHRSSPPPASCQARHFRPLGVLSQFWGGCGGTGAGATCCVFGEIAAGAGVAVGALILIRRHNR